MLNIKHAIGRFHVTSYAAMLDELHKSLSLVCNQNFVQHGGVFFASVVVLTVYTTDDKLASNTSR